MFAEYEPYLLCARRSELCLEAINKAGTVAHLGTHVDETGQIAQWHLPAAHYLETWSDARAYDGTVSIVQPMIDPLYGGKTAHDVLQTILDEPMLSSAYQAVRTTWQSTIKGDFEIGWRKALHDGWIEGTAYATGGSTQSARPNIPAPSAKDSLEIIFRPDPTIYDGRWSNVGWMQELPKPITNLSWDNAAIVSGATLTKLGLGRRRHCRDLGGRWPCKGASHRGSGPS